MSDEEELAITGFVLLPYEGPVLLLNDGSNVTVGRGRCQGYSPVTRTAIVDGKLIKWQKLNRRKEREEQRWQNGRYYIPSGVY